MTKPKKRTSLHREAAAERQDGRCFYCGIQMCRGNPSEFAASSGLSPAQAIRLSSTAEHLIARQDGGRDTVSNIAAACWECNQRRHSRKMALDPGAYRKLVSSRIRAGKRHLKEVFEAGLLLR